MMNHKPVVLVVDDQATVNAIILSILKDEYDARSFTNAQQALDYTLSHHVDLILLDYEMPGMSGPDMMRILRVNKQTAAIPVIFLTALSNSQIEADMLNQGASDYITKPFKSPVLFARIRMQLELYTYRARMEQLVDEKTKSLCNALDIVRKRDKLTIQMLARVTDLRDHETGDHIRRTTALVRIITLDLLDHLHLGYEVSPEMAQNIIDAAKLHDLGKIAIPDHILLKPGRLTTEEFDIIKSHTTHGARLLEELLAEASEDVFLRTANDIVLHHHEKWNGTGYPAHLKGDQIPLAARIVSLADAYDAITSIRPYKQAQSHEEAAAIIRDESGEHFDPYLVQVFLRHTIEFAAMTQQDLSPL